MYKIEKTIRPEIAGKYLTGFIIPVILIFSTPFYFGWSSSHSFADLGTSFLNWKFLMCIIAGIFLHEIIHGFMFFILSKGDFKSIKFGIKNLNPYCHFKKPISKNKYTIAVLMPGILMGIIPSIIAIFNGNLFLLGLGIFFTITAIGDFLIWFMLFQVDSSLSIKDHPSAIGFYLESPTPISEQEYSDIHKPWLLKLMSFSSMAFVFCIVFLIIFGGFQLGKYLVELFI